MHLSQPCATGATASPPRTPPAPFRLVDEFQAGYLKFNGREPRTLAELATAAADHQHRTRLAEIKAMAGKLALLDAFLPALIARGIRLQYREIHLLNKGKALRIHSVVLTPDDALYQALTEQGFREIAREESWRGSKTDQVTLKHGRALHVVIDVSKLPPQPAPAQGGDA